MLEITRPLIEHYLRATGWALQPRQMTTYHSPRGDWAVVLSSDTVTDHIRSIAGAARLSRAVVAFRLGVCASAERLLARERIIGLATNVDGNRAATYRTAAMELLATLGIPLHVWESAME